MEIALAFESGGPPADCARTLTVLRGASVRATVFLDGQWAEAHPDLVRAAVADGHELGNHGYSHSDLMALSEDEVAAEIRGTEAVAQRVAGSTTRPWLRPPFQRVDDRVRRVAALEGFRCLCRDALDGTHHLGPRTAGALLARSLARAHPGAVLTYHLHHPLTAAVLPEVIARLRAQGYRLGPVSALPVPPPERDPRHADFAAVCPAPGYRWMERPLPPPRMVNLVDVGTDALARAEEAREVVGGLRGTLCLLVYNGRRPLRFPGGGPAAVLCLAGEAALEVGDGQGPVCRAVVRAGDLLELRPGWEAVAAPRGGRAVLAVLE